MNTPDRSGPSLNLLADSAENVDPAFPFNYCPTHGFIAIDPAVTYGPVAATELIVTGIGRATVNDCIAVCNDRGVFISAGVLAKFSSWNVTTPTDMVDLVAAANRLLLNEQTKYIVRITVLDKDTLNVKLIEYSSGRVVGDGTLTVTDMFAGNPTFTVGYPTDEQSVAIVANGWVASTSLSVHAMQVQNPGPTAVTVLPAVAKTTAEVGYWVGNLWATHARAEALPCTFALVAGTGDTDNASFSIRGTNLHVAGALTAGAKSIRVQATDRYGATFAQALTITVS